MSTLTKWCLALYTEKRYFYYDRTTKTVIHQGENGFPFEVPNFKISRMFSDSQGNLWIGSVDQGYVVHYRYKKLFNNNSYLSSFFKDKSVISLSADKNGIYGLLL